MASSSQKLRETLAYINRLKKDKNLRIIDVHQHPYDVMGAVHPSEYKPEDEVSTKKYWEKSILELFKYGKVVTLVSPLYYKFLPSSVQSIIRLTYEKAGEKRLLAEMDEASIDQAFLLPISPWSDNEAILNTYQSDRFYMLHSPDIHNKSKDTIVQELKKCRELGVIGLKMHPNLQCFYPQPSQNSSLEMVEKLRAIYQTAEEERLVVLFHGGKSFYTDQVNKLYENVHTPRSRTHGVLENFANQDGYSEIFENYKFPVIIAHLGHFGTLSPNFELMRRVVERYSQVYFDTSGCEPALIRGSLEAISSERIVFGTDGIYNREIFGIHFLLEAVESVSKEKKDVMMESILGNNIKIILENNNLY
jgi:predicted TIM-barrel fold metal-dependent hydrolase